MKSILVSLNSKYIHTNLAIRYLKEYVRDIAKIEIFDFTINQPIGDIVAIIYKEKPDLLGFSTYIWNIRETLEVCEMIKIISPHTKILLGGPEVSFNSEELLEKYPFLDYIICGEGESSFRKLLLQKDLKMIDGLTYRNDCGILISNSQGRLIKDLDSIPSPYESVGDDYNNKIVYYEATRGCPFNCKFCLSSTIDGVRFFSLERVKRDLKKLIDAGVKQVKFVDRTFNADKKYAMELFKYLNDLSPEDTNFHMELTAHLIDEEMLSFFANAKEGLFQFEIGVQTTNPETINAIGRVTDFVKLRNISKQIKSFNRIHQHLDLIAGLPYEDYYSFRNSFNDVYEIKPEKIQLGFLKLLRGSELREKSEKYGFKFLDKPPYEILETAVLNYSHILKLKEIENLVERYYNEGYFKHSVEFVIINHFDNPFDFYDDFSSYWQLNNLFEVSHSRNMLYNIFINYYKHREFGHLKIFLNIIKYDFNGNNKKNPMPFFVAGGININQSDIHNILKDENLLNTHLEDYRMMPTKKLLNKVDIVSFDINVLKIIENNYVPLVDNVDNHEIILLFCYRESDVNRYKVFNITEFAKELF